LPELCSVQGVCLWWLCWYFEPWVSGELALESIDADGRRDQHEPGGVRERRRRDRPHHQGPGAADAAGAHALELLLVSHGRDIGRREVDL
jgi:hypothetical protein